MTSSLDSPDQHRTDLSETGTPAEAQNLMREPIRLESTILPVVNYALQQNRMPVIQTLSIINNTDKPLEKINIKITATPELCLPWTKPVDFVPANSVYDIKDVRIILNAAFLAGLTEKVTGLLRLALVCEDTVLFTDTREMTVLAYDAWHGYAYYPELLTSFVMPNHPEIARINAEASRILGAWTGDPSLDAYQSQDPDRVLSQAAAVYAALQKQNIVYAVHPASFEKVGQRIRLCDAVLQCKMGTCLDLALLYASCLEAIGLHSILILKRDHIISGVWLEDLSFPESVQDDASLITKRLASGVREIAVVETTLLVAGKRVSFDEARAVAEQELAGQNPVEYIIDVTRARLSGITPLPMRIQTENGWTIERKTLHDSALTPGPKDYGKTIRVDVASGEDKFSKKIQWERKLLDLGLRNTLINMRMSRTMIPLLASSLDDLEDALADGSDFTMLPRPVDWQVSADGIDFETMHVLSGYENLIKSEFKNRRLRSAYTETELTRTVKALYRSYKAALEENGANTLYLALGLLRWYEMAKSTKPRYAPLILIPVDMVRKSASQGYVIRLRDDEPQMNITLLEMLKQNFSITVGGLDPLPQDEHGIDSRRAFTILRQAIMGQARWDVLESAYLGIFSFSQFVMWNDIRNRSDDLERNKIVRSLIDGKLAWAANNMAIGQRVSEDHAFLPLPADASQLFAIEQACKGESYVLHGPPGTGKSQTITALIANALAQGKTVLFVAEKMAALEVVEKRLDKIGLGTFCLELHSNKAKKRDVLEQLRLATEVTKFTAAEAYAQKATQIAALRQDLDRYAHALHKPQKCGRTLYQLINQYEGYHEAAEIPAFPFAFADTATGALLEQQEAVIERLVVAGKEIGHPHNHPLQAIGCTLYSQQIRTVLPGAVAQFRTAVQAIDAAGHALALAIGEPLPSRFDDLGRIAFIANELVVWLDLPRAWAASSNINRYLVDVSDMARHYIKANEWYAQLFPHWTSDFFQLEGNRLFAEHQEASGKWFLGKMLAMNKLEKQVAGYAKNKLEKSALGQQLSVLAAYQAEKSAADALFGTYGNDLEHFYQGADTDWQKIIRLAMGAKESAEKIENLCGSDHVRLNHGGNKKHSSRIQALNAAWADLFPAKQALYALLDITEYTGSAWAQHQEELCGNMLTHADHMKEWITWNSIASDAVGLGLQPVVAAYKKGLPHDDVKPAYKKAVFQLLASAAIDSDMALNHFSGAVFSEKIEQLRRMDGELTKLAQQEIYCRLASKVPDFTREAAQSSELGILQRAIRSGGRGVSIRKIFEQIPNLLPRLCACMLMSPISAAQYLEPNREPFDIVVFDEASQLPTSKAIGALARGKDAIVVGDPKQMPPTSFFATNSVDEDNLDVEDLESILDDCLALNMPQTHLLWHYRSRHESLIAFSNSQFYDNKLYTFPSANAGQSKVALVPVNGVFERGKTRQNRAEAEAVVQELVRRCHDEERSKYSVGVVTFNISQQNLIDDLLADACKQDEKLDQWVYSSAEPLFIKNLENVQGDERDIIMFSIGYGPDADGKVTMNFGPLNREGGWRRLNVAVSRARHEMVVYSSLGPDQIDLARTSARGVAALKAFLEYAGGSQLAQDENTARPDRETLSGIAQSICSVLQGQGYATQQNVGHSAYRVDIGVVDPQQPGQFLLGILLDGSGYGSAKTTRDREIAQISVLKGLGWRVHRVWSMDWWDNSGREIKRIVSKLKEAENPPKQKSVPEEGIPAVVPVAVQHTAIEQQVKLPAQRVEKKQVIVEAPPYTPAKLYRQSLNPDQFLHPGMIKAIQAKVSAVLAHEAPVSERLLTRRVLQSFGIARSGNRIQARMDEVCRRMMLKKTVHDGDTFYWRSDQKPEAYAGYRVSGTGAAKRDVKDVPVQETANAIYTVLYEQISMGRDDLLREAAKKLGYARLGGNVVSSMVSGVHYAEEQGGITLNDNGAYLLSPDGTARAEATMQTFQPTTETAKGL